MSLTAFVSAILSRDLDTTIDDARWPYDCNVSVREGGDGMRDGGWRAALPGNMRTPGKISRALVKQVQQLNLMHRN